MARLLSRFCLSALQPSVSPYWPELRQGAPSNSVNESGHERKLKANQIKIQMAQKILFADDDPLMHRLYKSHVERAGYEWIGASDGREAIQAVASAKPG